MMNYSRHAVIFLSAGCCLQAYLSFGGKNNKERHDNNRRSLRYPYQGTKFVFVLPDNMKMVETEKPSNVPSNSPSHKPTTIPTNNPSKVPAMVPSLSPSNYPSFAPNKNPSLIPSKFPSLVPSVKTELAISLKTVNFSIYEIELSPLKNTLSVDALDILNKETDNVIYNNFISPLKAPEMQIKFSTTMISQKLDPKGRKLVIRLSKTAYVKTLPDYSDNEKSIGEDFSSSFLTTTFLDAAIESSFQKVALSKFIIEELRSIPQQGLEDLSFLQIIFVETEKSTEDPADQSSLEIGAYVGAICTAILFVIFLLFKGLILKPRGERKTYSGKSIGTASTKSDISTVSSVPTKHRTPLEAFTPKRGGSVQDFSFDDPVYNRESTSHRPRTPSRQEYISRPRIPTYDAVPMDRVRSQMDSLVPYVNTSHSRPTTPASRSRSRPVTPVEYEHYNRPVTPVAVDQYDRYIVDGHSMISDQSVTYRSMPDIRPMVPVKLRRHHSIDVSTPTSQAYRSPRTRTPKHSSLRLRPITPTHISKSPRTPTYMTSVPLTPSRNTPSKSPKIDTGGKKNTSFLSQAVTPVDKISLYKIHRNQRRALSSSHSMLSEMTDYSDYL